MTNNDIFHSHKDFHTNDGGQHPDAYAITEMIKQSVLDKTYKIYYGGGYEHKTDNPILKYDVVAMFSIGGDPTFLMCIDDTEGDQCDLVKSNPECTFEKIVK